MRKNDFVLKVPSYSTGKIINYLDLYLILVNNTKLKKCNCCDELKPIDQFYKVKNGKYGVIGTCKTCYSLKHKEKYRSNNQYREQCKTYAREYYRQNTEQVKKNVKEWMQNHPDYVKRYVLKWREDNREQYRDYIREYLRGWRKKQ